jgi:hypothetical protein
MATISTDENFVISGGESTTPPITKDDELEPEFIKKREVLDKKAEKIKDSVKFPKFPSRQVSVEVLQEWVNMLTIDMLPNLFIYVYRHFPIVVNQLADPDSKNNIEKLSGTTENGKNEKLNDIYNWIKREHGGGLFRLDIIDIAQPPKVHRIGECRINIPMMEVDPILNLHTLDVENKENRAYVNKLIAQGKLHGRTKEVIEPSKGGPTTEVYGFMKDMLEMVKGMSQSQVDSLRKQLSANEGNSSNKDLQQIMIEVMKQNDPAKLIGLINAITSTKSKESNGDSVNLQLVLIKMMELQSQANTAMMGFMMKMMDVFDKMLGAFERFTAMKGGKGNGDDDDRPKGIWDRVADIAERVAEPLSMVIANKMMMPSMVPGNGNGNQGQMGMTGTDNNAGSRYTPPASALPNKQIAGTKPYNAYDPNTNRAAQQAAQRQANVVPQQQVNPQVVNNPQQQQQTPLTPQQELTQAIMMYGNMIMNALNSGMTGEKFAQWVVEGFGIQPIMSIRRFTLEQVMETVKSIPEFWNAVSALGEEYIGNWIHEFATFEPGGKVVEE